MADGGERYGTPMADGGKDMERSGTPMGDGRGDEMRRWDGGATWGPWKETRFGRKHHGKTTNAGKMGDQEIIGHHGRWETSWKSMEDGMGEEDASYDKMRKR